MISFMSGLMQAETWPSADGFSVVETYAGGTAHAVVATDIFDFETARLIAENTLEYKEFDADEDRDPAAVYVKPPADLQAVKIELRQPIGEAKPRSTLKVFVGGVAIEATTYDELTRLLAAVQNPQD